MPPEIFSFLQTQVNTQLQQLLPGTTPQENTGTMPGIFDALIAEYALPENTAEIQPQSIAHNNTTETLPPLTFRNSTLFTGKIADVPAEENSQGHNGLPEVKQTFSGNNPSWQNLFADVRRTSEAPVMRQLDTQNDFDEGVTVFDAEIVADSKPDIDVEAADVLPPENIAPEIAEDTVQVKPEVATPENSDSLPHEHTKPDNLTETHEHSETTSTHEITQQEIPEQGITDSLPNERMKPYNVTETHEHSETTATHKATQPQISEQEISQTQISDSLPNEHVKPHNLMETHEHSEPTATHETSQPKIPEQEISDSLPNEHTKPDNLTETHEHSEPTATHETSQPQISEQKISEPQISDSLPNEHVKPNNLTETHEHSETTSTHEITQQEIPEQGITDSLPNERMKPYNLTETHEHSETTATHKTSQPQKPEQEISQPQISDSLPNEHVKPNNVTDSHEHSEPTATHETPQPEIIEPNTDEKTEPTRDDEPQEEYPEIREPNIVMAGFQAVQAAPNTPAPEETPEIIDSPKTSRTRNIPARKSQPLTREPQYGIGITDSDSLTDDSRIVTPEISRTTQAQIGHEEITEPESNQPSESQDTNATPSQQIPHHQAGTSRTQQRTASSNDTRADSRRTEALSDFQTFFEGVSRVRRSPARVNSQPLSLRTETYGASVTQSQSQTLRNGIVNTVRFIRADGVRKASIIVDPPALGRISVELTSSSSGVEASVKVANEQIRQIVQDQFTQLRDNLLQQGVQVSEFTVDVQQDNSRQGQDSGGHNQNDYYSYTPSDDDDDTEIFRADLEEGLLYWIA